MTKRDEKKAATTLDTRTFADARAWARWLAAHHATSPGLWLKLAKTTKGVAALTYAQAVEAALAWGWIDSHKNGLDAAWWLQKFTPRGPRSLWSEVNRTKALALIEAGAMKPAGLAAVERAKANGSWERAYAPQRTSAVPDDLARALAASPRAAAFFATLESRNRYAILYRLQTAKKAETRAARLARFVELLERGEKLHP